MPNDLEELSHEFIHSMEGNLEALRTRWETLEEVYGLDANPVFWMLLNSLVMVAAEKGAPPETIDIYLRHMERNRNSLLNLYRQSTPKRATQ
mgnify:CR=1 FL=1